MHVGHIRSTVLGDALARIAQFLGHEVIRDNHIGDWGTQFGMVIYGWKNLLDRQALRARSHRRACSHLQGSERASDSDPAVREACRQEFVKLQGGDAENVAIWKQCVDLSMKEFERTYQVLDIHYDIQRGESFYNDRLPGVVDRLLKSGSPRSAKARLCFLSRNSRAGGQACHHSKKDGGFNYATTDIATVDYRVDDLKARHHLVRGRRTADSAFQTDLRDRAARGLHS